MILRYLILMMLILPVPALAMTVAVVEAVQERAAFLRDGWQQPITIGTQLQNEDVITTGGNARVRIRFPDGSLVRVGEFAQVKFDRLIPPAQKKGRLTGLFNVLKGVFRFTSGHTSRPDVKIEVGHSITVGIRGTDVYTHAKPNKDIVCLIKGAVSVEAVDVEAMLTQPREGFVVPKGQAPLPVRVISEEVFQKWLENSEMEM
jgi:hypothetical protein